MDWRCGSSLEAFSFGREYDSYKVATLKEHRNFHKKNTRFASFETTGKLIWTYAFGNLARLQNESFGNGRIEFSNGTGKV